MSKEKQNQDEMKKHIEATEMSNKDSKPTREELNQIDQDQAQCLADIKNDLQRMKEFIGQRKKELEAEQNK